MFFIVWFLLVETSRAAPSADNCTIKHDRLVCLQHLTRDRFPSRIKILELHDIVWDVIDMNEILDRFPHVENISIYGANITKFILPKNQNNVKVFQLKKAHLESVSLRFFRNFHNLKELNFQDNFLHAFSGNFSTLKLEKIYLSGNKWNCSLDLSWVLQLKEKIKDVNELKCYGEPHSGKSLLTIAEFMKDLDKCPEKCKCSLPKVARKSIESEALEPMIEVNCSYRGLAELPEGLPPDTRFLRLEGNEIEDLSPLKLDRGYRGILDLYIDNNKVKSIEGLEGSYWLKHFRVFSISGNKLTELPTYALDNALEQNTNMPKAVKISLGGNPWRCDCFFTPVFQEMLQKFAPQIEDISEVKCSYVEGDENSLLPIIELSRSSVCRSPTEYSVQALDLLNGVLASLILLILGKLAYDYYYFKKTGRLPWIVTKMP